MPCHARGVWPRELLLFARAHIPASVPYRPRASGCFTHMSTSARSSTWCLGVLHMQSRPRTLLLLRLRLLAPLLFISTRHLDELGRRENGSHLPRCRRLRGLDRARIWGGDGIKPRSSIAASRASTRVEAVGAYRVQPQLRSREVRGNGRVAGACPPCTRCRSVRRAAALPLPRLLLPAEESPALPRVRLQRVRGMHARCADETIGATKRPL